jgi:hypothetical protein
VIGVFVKVLPMADHGIDPLIATKRQDRVDMIWHHKEDRDVPSLLSFVKTGRVEKSSRQPGLGQ